MLYTMLTATNVNPFQTVSEPIISLLDMALTPALGIVGALGAIYCIILGAKLAKAEEPQDREKAKNSLKNAIIGFVLIFVLIVVLKLGMGAMQTRMNNSINETDHRNRTCFAGIWIFSHFPAENGKSIKNGGAGYEKSINERHNLCS